VLWQVMGMAGVVHSLATGWKWLWSLYKGPIKRMKGTPRRRLLMVPPPVKADQAAPAPQAV
jgi:hypothetical protein